MKLKELGPAENSKIPKKKNEIKINYDKPKVTNYWKKLPKTEFSSSVLFAKFIKKVAKVLERERAERSCSFSNLVVYSITSAGIKLPNWKNPIAPKALTVIGYQGEMFSRNYAS